MSIYHHFPSKHHLLDAMVERALADVEIPDAGPDIETRLRRMLESYRAMARRYPALYPLIAVHRLNMPAGVRMIERTLNLIHAATGGDVELTARQFRAIGYYLTGASLDEAAGYAAGPSAVEPVSDAWVAEHCPLLSQVGRWFKPEHWDATWQYGLDALIRRAREDAAAREVTPVASGRAKKRA
jgi:AcrR family transcriptional regulator